MRSGYLLAAGIVLIGSLGLATLWLLIRQPSSSPPSLTVPDGFTVELAAGPPLLERPITAAFDDQGRLYVADSSGSNDPVEVQLREKPHRIVLLEDQDGDGRFDRSTLFADRMMFPEGTLWLDGSVYVAAPPSIWKLTDTDGDGVADEREEWFEGKTLTGCANDLHGPYLGPDGWIYWCKGGFAQQTYPRPGRPPLVTRAAHIFRRHPRDPYVEPVLTGGMDNPVDVDFTPEGERILTATFFEHPQLGRRDALLHAVYGGLYGKVHDVLDGHPTTGELMPHLTHFGPAAPAGLTRYASAVFGEEFQDNFFACLFNLHKVTRHLLEPHGATFQTRDSDFLVSSDPDFHPTDVLEDADGSLLVINTGGWYKLCCPTSQLEKPDVLGAIYRVRRRGARGPEDPWGLRIDWNSLEPRQLAPLLEDPRPAVRERAIGQLARWGSESLPSLVEVLKQSPSVAQRRNAVWALTRMEEPEARQAVHLALQDAASSVRHAAAHSAAVRRDPSTLPFLLERLQDEDLQVRRAAAEALGRLGNRAAVAPLLSASASPVDRVMEHSLIYALIEIGAPEETAQGLQAASPQTKRAALIALDQMQGSPLHASTVVPLLTSPDPQVQETAWWVAGRHPEWGADLAGFFARRLAEEGPPSDQERLEARLAQFASNPAIQELLARATAGSFPRSSRKLALRAMSRGGLKELPAAWTDPLVNLLAGKDPDLLSEVVSLLRTIPLPEAPPPRLEQAVKGVSQDSSLPLEVRLKALAALPGLPHVEPKTFELLRSTLDPSRPLSLRSLAAGVLEKARLSGEQLLSLTDTLTQAGPLELARLLPAFAEGGSEEVGLRMVAALEQARALPSLRSDLLLSLLSRYPESVQSRGQALLASLDLDPAAQKAHLDELLASLEEGDVRRGQAVFNSEKAACSTCHTIGYLGGKLGPDLTRIGEIRTERDLLEAIVYPSASFVRSYEPVVVTTRSGETYNGILRKDSPEEVILATATLEEISIARSEISDLRPGTVSVMPAGLEQQLSRQELFDLVAFLKAARRHRR